MAKQSSGTGKGGKSFQDRELAARVRTMALTEIEKVLKRPKMDELKKAVILKLASTVLPRINEHTGGNGDPMQFQITGMTIAQDGADIQNKESEAA